MNSKFSIGNNRLYRCNKLFTLCNISINIHCAGSLVNLVSELKQFYINGIIPSVLRTLCAPRCACASGQELCEIRRILRCITLYVKRNGKCSIAVYCLICFYDLQRPRSYLARCAPKLLFRSLVNRSYCVLPLKASACFFAQSHKRKTVFIHSLNQCRVGGCVNRIALCRNRVFD